MQHQEAITNENVNGAFQMTVEDVFTITGRGTVVTGRITSGKININETVINRNSGQRYMVAGIEMFRKALDYEFWIGMPVELLRLGQGTPDDYSYTSEHDIYIYGDLYIFVEDKRVVGWY